MTIDNIFSDFTSYHYYNGYKKIKELAISEPNNILIEALLNEARKFLGIKPNDVLYNASLSKEAAEQIRKFQTIINQNLADIESFSKYGFRFMSAKDYDNAEYNFRILFCVKPNEMSAVNVFRALWYNEKYENAEAFAVKFISKNSDVSLLKETWRIEKQSPLIKKKYQGGPSPEEIDPVYPLPDSIVEFFQNFDIDSIFSELSKYQNFEGHEKQIRTLLNYAAYVQAWSEYKSQKQLDTKSLLSFFSTHNMQDHYLNPVMTEEAKEYIKKYFHSLENFSKIDINKKFNGLAGAEFQNATPLLISSSKITTLVTKAFKKLTEEHYKKTKS